MNAAELSAMICHNVTDIIGLIGNGLLIYIAVFKSPKNIRTYSLLIINFGITDFCCSLTALFVEQRLDSFLPSLKISRLIPIGLSLAYISSGPCRFFGTTVCYIGYSAMLHFYAHSLWSLFLSFLYRYYVLLYSTPRPRTLILVLLSFYSLSFFQFVSFFSFL